MIGKRLAHYEITDLIGKGGMGEVYRATDTTLGRAVAIKVLPADLAADTERIARFQREARTLATLQQTNVASVYGFEDTGDTRFLVMELVEGQDLAARARDGGLDAEEILDFAVQMARGLEAAHEQGIVHRDLKPANVMVTPDGVVKILDFGLARAVQGDPQSETDLAHSPTITAGMTQAGVVLGTAAYMSPEQARGKAVDKRADIWAFGVILYELLTGRRLFGGETVSDTFAAVLREDIDFDALPDDTPVPLQQVVRRCLVRDPKARLRDVGEARVLLEGGDVSGWIATSSIEAAAEPGPARRTAWIVAVVVALVVGGALGWSLRTNESTYYHLEVSPPPDHVFRHRGIEHALSPDGTMLAFVAQDTLDRTSLWIRRLDQRTSIRLDGTEGAEQPFWSPDSRTLGFFAQNAMARVSAVGGPVTPIAPAANPRGGWWLEDGTILYAPSTRGPIQRVAASGGASTIATPDAGEENFTERFPTAAPGANDAFLYLRWAPDYAAITTRVDGEAVPVVDAEFRAEWIDDRLFTVQGGNLLVHTVHGPRLERAGEPIVLVDGVSTFGPTGAAAFSVSPAGPISYSRADIDYRMFARVYDRDGTGRPTMIPDMDFDDLAMSDDGERFVIAGSPIRGTTSTSAAAVTGIDLWVYDVPRDVLTRVTFDGESDDPAFSGDGEWIVYSTHGDVARTRASGVGGHEVLYEDDADKLVNDWSPDGDWVVFVSSTASDSDDLWVLDLREEEPVAAPLIATPFREYHAEFSPDGAWLAYASTESGEAQVYVVDFPGLTQKIQITRRASAMPRWSRDGAELMVIDENRMLQAISFEVVDGRPVIGEPVDLLRTEIGIQTRTHQYDADDAGESIVVLESSNARASREPLHVVTDWRRWVEEMQR